MCPRARGLARLIENPSPVVGQTSCQVQFPPDPIFFTWLRVEGTRRKRAWRPGDAPSVGHQTSRLIIVRSSPRATEDARTSDAHKWRTLDMHLQKITGLPAVPLPVRGQLARPPRRVCGPGWRKRAWKDAPTIPDSRTYVRTVCVLLGAHRAREDSQNSRKPSAGRLPPLVRDG